MQIHFLKCDGAGCVAEAKVLPKDAAGWAHVAFIDSDKLNNPMLLDYCPKCWETMFTSLITPRERVGG